MGNEALLYSELDAVSYPSSPRYGKWLTLEEANAITATPAAIAKEVTAWATSTGARCTRRPEALSCVATVAQIEQLLSGELSTYAHLKTGQTVIRTSMAKPGFIPTRLTGKVTILTGLSQFPMGQRTGTMRPEALYRAQSGDTDYAIVPEVINKFYNHENADDSTTMASAGPIEFQNYPAIEFTDIDAFAKGVAMPTWTVPKNQTVGAFNPGAGDESALDEQYIVAMSPGANPWYWTEADWQ